MKNIFLLSLLLLLPSLIFAQSTYYQNTKGDIVDSLTYESSKIEKLEEIRTTMKRENLEVVDDLTVIRQNEDSIIVTYKWIFTEKLEKKPTESHNNHLYSNQSLVGKPFPFEILGLERYENGKPTLINLWFVGCKPCVDEMPILNKFQKEYEERINFVALTYNSTEVVEEFLKKHSFTFKHHTGIENLSKKLEVNSFPTNILLDENGIVVEVMNGIPYVKDRETEEVKIGDGKELKEKLDKLLAN